MKKILLLPYPVKITTAAWWKICLTFSAFVFLFLLVFRPFGLYDVRDNLSVIVLGYGLICFAVMVSLNIGIIKVFPNFFSEKSWTIGKEIFWTLANILLIGIANAIYSFYLDFFSLDILTFLKFIFYASVIGLFPITVFTFIRQWRLRKKFLTESGEINKIIVAANSQPAQTNEALTVEIPSQNINEHFTAVCSQIIFIRSADNYVEIFYLDKNKVQRKLIRNTMKEMEHRFRVYPQFFRCHKSFLVNLEKVNHVSGNAQGLKLVFKEVDELVPVSRNLTKNIRERIAVYH